MPHYEWCCESYVAKHPNPIGTVEFYGGQFFGQIPKISYEYFFQQLYDAGYTLIIVPYQFTTNHYEVALSLLKKRDCVRQKCPELYNKPHIWVGHSLGCKLIAMLEAFTTDDNVFNVPKKYLSLLEGENINGILNEPSLLIAPDFADNEDLIPIPFIGDLMDDLGIGVKPKRSEIRKSIEESSMFNLTGIISFASDNTAGHVSSPLDKDVPWLLKTLADRKTLLKQEIPGDHLTPTGNEVFGYIVGTEMVFDFLILPEIQKPPREVEPLAVSFIGELANRLSVSLRGVKAK